ncbi:hypothetical protein [Algibacter mikhailovii]|uniref:hypothetical protein n=1 Tax=Algibacter mikhailovii TaxID=425498 RepID=UPI002493E08A|nr:hypothetical protein [Algibacter mikhailovii]
MKKSIHLLVLLAIVFLITDRLVCLSLIQFDKKVFSGQSVGKVNHFLLLKDTVDLLVFGSSRANHHIDNKRITSSSFNIGVDGSRIGHSATLISSLNKKNQVVLVHIDHKFIYDLEYTGEDMLSLKNLIKRNDTIKTFINNYFPEEVYIANAVNSYVYNGKVLGILKNYLKPKYNYMLYDGFDPLIPSQEQKDIFEKMIKLENRNNKSEDYELSDLEINPLIDDLVEEIKQICQKNNSKLIFFTSPSLILEHETLRLRTKNYFKSKHLLYYDYSDFFKNYNSEYWRDFTHMSEKGAIVFTEAIENELLMQ